MKVNLNLARAQGFRQRHLVAWSLPVLGLGFLLLLRMVVGAESNWNEYRSVREAADKEAARQTDLLAHEAALHRKLDEPDNRALLREVKFINDLIDERRLSFGELTDKVTALLPPQARLAGLSMPDASGEPLVHFAIEGASEEPVETFLTNLEESPDFRDLIITNQGFEEKESGGAPVSITCNARYVGGRSDLELTVAKTKTAEPAGQEILTAPAPNVKTGVKTATGLGMPAATPQAAASAVPLRAGTASAAGPVVPSPGTPAVKTPAAKTPNLAPGIPVRVGTPPATPAANPPQPKTN
jgi:hypothetical protein